MENDAIVKNIYRKMRPSAKKLKKKKFPPRNALTEDNSKLINDT